MAVVAAVGKLTPCEERGDERRQCRGLADLAMSQGQEAVVHRRESNRVRHVTYLKRSPTAAGNPYALRAVLQDQSHAGLIVGDGSMHALAVAVVLNLVAN